MGSGALRGLLEITLQSSTASSVVVRRQARKEQKRKFSAYLPEQNLHQYPSQKRCGFYLSSFPAALFRVDTICGTKDASMCVCSLVSFLNSSPEEFRTLNIEGTLKIGGCEVQWKQSSSTA